MVILSGDERFLRAEWPAMPSEDIRQNYVYTCLYHIVRLGLCLGAGNLYILYLNTYVIRTCRFAAKLIPPILPSL